MIYYSSRLLHLGSLTWLHAPGALAGLEGLRWLHTSVRRLVKPPPFSSTRHPPPAPPSRRDRLPFMAVTRQRFKRTTVEAARPLNSEVSPPLHSPGQSRSHGSSPGGRDREAQSTPDGTGSKATWRSGFGVAEECAHLDGAVRSKGLQSVSAGWSSWSRWGGTASQGWVWRGSRNGNRVHEYLRGLRFAASGLTLAQVTHLPGVTQSLKPACQPRLSDYGSCICFFIL